MKTHPLSDEARHRPEPPAPPFFACPDILIQVSAASSALNSFTKELLAQHIHTCVAQDIRAGRDEAIDELVKLLLRLMR